MRQCLEEEKKHLYTIHSNKNQTQLTLIKSTMGITFLTYLPPYDSPCIMASRTHKKFHQTPCVHVKETTLNESEHY